MGTDKPGKKGIGDHAHFVRHPLFFLIMLDSKQRTTTRLLVWRGGANSSTARGVKVDLARLVGQHDSKAEW